MHEQLALKVILEIPLSGTVLNDSSHNSKIKYTNINIPRVFTYMNTQRGVQNSSSSLLMPPKCDQYVIWALKKSSMKHWEY